MQLIKNNLFKDGHLSDESTACYTNALLEGKFSTLPEEVLTHVEACSDCKDRILELSLFLRNPDSSSFIYSHNETLAKIRRKWYAYPVRLAAALFVAALLLSTYLFVQKDGSILQEILFKSPVTGKNEKIEEKLKLQREMKRPHGKNHAAGKNRVPKKNNKLPPDNFRVNPNLESMIGTQYRSVSMQILSPVNNSTMNGDIVFAWEKSTIGPLILKIINNRNIVAYNYEVTGNQLLFNQKLTPGLYYWKLENQKDLLYLGKFFIKSNSK